MTEKTEPIFQHNTDSIREDNERLREENRKMSEESVKIMTRMGTVLDRDDGTLGVAIDGIPLNEVIQEMREQIATLQATLKAAS